MPKLPSFKQLTVHRENSNASETSLRSESAKSQSTEGEFENGSELDPSSPSTAIQEGHESNRDIGTTNLIEKFAGRRSKNRSEQPLPHAIVETGTKELSRDKQRMIQKLGREVDTLHQPDKIDDPEEPADSCLTVKDASTIVDDFNKRIAEQQPALIFKTSASSDAEPEEDLIQGQEPQDPPSSSVVQNAFDRMRPRRNIPEVATITIGSKTMTSVLGSSSSSKVKKDTIPSIPVTPKTRANNDSRANFSSSLRSFAAPGSEFMKTIGGPQSESRLSVDYSQNDDDGQVSPYRPSPTSSPSREDDNALGSGDDTHHCESVQESIHQGFSLAEAESNAGYVDEDEKKATEEARVAELIRQAEEASSMPSQDNKKRAHQILKGAGQKDSTAQLVQVIDASVERIEKQLAELSTFIRHSLELCKAPESQMTSPTIDTSPEERLSLTVSKADFGAMHILGQFNLGFILATRNNADLFIIDQHASDEKYNFERLQATTVVQNQRLVHPRILQLTAVEEEIIFEHKEALLKNGFLIDADTSGESPVGQRCKLISLPMSREVVFDTSDLEELIALLADSSTSSSMENVPRPSKVRRMFAMRACRSSIMVGKTLTLKQMENLVRKMGEIEKPWNCPHGRPTMRHICGLGEWEGWTEGDGLTGMEEEIETVDWGSWISGMNGRQEDSDIGDDHDGGEDIGDGPLNYEEDDDGESGQDSGSDE